jgi:hypothetical protein
VKETAAQALSRLCSLGRPSGLELDGVDLAALPAGAPKGADVCGWQAAPIR